MIKLKHITEISAEIPAFQSNTVNSLMESTGMVNLALHHDYRYIEDDEQNIYEIFKIAESNINFQRGEKFLDEVKSVYEADFTHILSSDGWVYEIVLSRRVRKLTEQEMLDIGMEPPEVLTDADAEADLAGEPRSDNPSAEATKLQQAEFTEPGDTHYCSSCDIISKIDDIIIARLKSKQTIDSESADVLTKLNHIALSRMGL